MLSDREEVEMLAFLQREYGISLWWSNAIVRGPFFTAREDARSPSTGDGDA